MTSRCIQLSFLCGIFLAALPERVLAQQCVMTGQMCDVAGGQQICETCCIDCDAEGVCVYDTSTCTGALPTAPNTDSAGDYYDDDSVLPPASDIPPSPPIPTDPERVCKADDDCTYTEVTIEGSSAPECRRDAELAACASAGLNEPSDHRPPRPAETPAPFRTFQLAGAGDPIALATGALRLDVTDLRLEGPLRPLEFRRRYSSRSDARGFLGSNWTHNFEDYLVVVRNDDPTAPPVCAAAAGVCVRYRDGSGDETLYIRPKDETFYIALTRADTTLHRTSAGWSLHAPDGARRIFNEDGYLIEERDRFGNGFTVSQEETPLYRMYRRWCLADGPSQHPNDDPRVCAALAYAFEEGPPRSWPTWSVPPGASVPLVTEKCQYQMRGDPRDGIDCKEVGFWDIPGELGFLPGLYVSQCGTEDPKFSPYVEPGGHTLAQLNDTAHAVRWGCSFTYTVCEEWPQKYREPVDQLGRVTAECEAEEWTPVSGKLAWPEPTTERVIVPQDGILYEEVALPEEPSSYIDRDSIAAFLLAGRVDANTIGRAHGMFFTPASPYGPRRYRPSSARDHLGRSITFRYFEPLDVNGPGYTGSHLGLLKSVHAIGGRTVSFRYSRPAGYPTRLNELFLTRAGAYGGGLDVDGVEYATTASGVVIENVAVDYEYDWPAVPGGGSYADYLYDFWRAHTSTRRGRQVASLNVLDYIASVADNIGRVVRGAPGAPIVEMESRYYRYPSDPSRDHVWTQRFGSGPLAPFDGWSIAAPKLTVRYFGANPRIALGEVSAELPADLRQKYPVESVPVSAREAASRGQPLAYYPASGEWTDEVRLRRTPLSCAAIARMEAGLPSVSASGLTPATLATLGETFRRDASRICAWTQLDDRDGTRRYAGFNARGDLLVEAVYEHDDERYIFTERIYDEDGRVRSVRTPTSRVVAGWQPHHGGTLFRFRGYSALDASSWRARGNLLSREEVPVGGAVENIDGENAESVATVTAVRRVTRFAYEPAFNQIGRVQWGTVDESGRERIAYELRHEYEGTCPSFSDVYQCSDSLIDCVVRTGVVDELLDALDDIDRCWRDGDCLGPAARFRKQVAQASRAQPAPAGRSRTPRAAPGRDAAERFDRWLKRARTFAGSTERHRAMDRRSRDRSAGSIAELRRGLAAIVAELRGPIRDRFGPTGTVANACALKRPTLLVFRNPAHPASAREIELQWNGAGQPHYMRERGGSTTRLAYYTSALVGWPDPSLEQNSISGMNRGFLARLTVSRFDEDYGDVVQQPPCDGDSGPYRFLLSPDCALQGTIEWPAELQAALARARSGTETSETAYEYSLIGLPSARVEDGLRWEFVRDPDGRITRMSSPDGLVTTIRRTRQGLPSLIETRHHPGTGGPSALVARTRQSFTSHGDVLRICRELTDGGCANFETVPAYNNQLIPVGRPYQLTVREYDANDRLRRETGPVGLVTERDYNARGLPIRVRRFQQGQPTTTRHAGYCYSDRGDIRRVLHGSDVRDQICADTRPAIVRSESPGGGTGGAVAAVPAPSATCPAPGPQRSYTEEVVIYDGLGRIGQRRDERGLRHRYRWTARDQIGLAESGDAVCGEVLTTRWTYDDHGQLARIVRNGVDTTSFKRGPWSRSVRTSRTGLADTVTIYDLDGRPLWRRDQAGDDHVLLEDRTARIAADLTIRRSGTALRIEQTLTQFDLAGRPVTAALRGRDEQGQVVERQRSWSWSPLGHPAGAQLFDGQVLSQDQRNLAGWPERVCASDSCATIHYDSAGNPKMVYDPADQLAIFNTWNVFGEWTSVRHAGEVEPLRWRYDALGRVYMHETPDGLTFLHHYDGRGDRVRIEHEQQLVREYSYDQHGRALRATYANRQGASSSPVSTTFAYDAWGNVGEETTEYPLGLAPRTVTRSLTAATSGVVDSRTYTGGSHWVREHDEAGRLVDVRRSPAPGAAVDTETSLRWSGAAYIGRQYRRPSMSDVVLFAEHIARDGLDRPTRKDVSGASPILQILGAYDANGRLATVAYVSGGAPTGAWRGYTYDDAGRLSDVLEAENVTPPPGLGTDGPIAVGEAIGATRWNYTRDDAFGSTTEVAGWGGSPVRWAIPQPRAPGHLIQSVALGGAPAVTVTHDARGRIATIGDRQFQYDVEGRLAAVTTQSGEVVERYLYGPGGELSVVIAANGSPVHTFLYDGSNAVMEYDATGKPLWEAAWGQSAASLLEWRELFEDGRTLVPISDFRHDVIEAWDVDAGVSAGSARFDPEGRVVSRTPAGDECREQTIGDVCAGAGGLPFAFAGAWRSEQTGLVWLGSRWYSPALSEFVSPDPLGAVDAWNRYAYAAFDPINKWDPFGLEAIELAKTCEDDDINSICIYNALTENGRYNLRKLPAHRIAFWDEYVLNGGERLRDIVLTHTAMNLIGEGVGLALRAAWHVGRWGIRHVMRQVDEVAEGAAEAAGHGLAKGVAEITTTVAPKATIIRGTLAGARQLQSRAAALQGARPDFPRRLGTTAVARVRNRATGEVQTWVATEAVGENAPAGIVLAQGEKYIGGAGHAEQTLRNALFDQNGQRLWDITEGGASRNICAEVCAQLLDEVGVTIGGPAFRGQGDKTMFRMFWEWADPP